MELDPRTGCPVIIYTGVYLKSNTSAVSKLGLPPPEHDMPTRFVEQQLAAVPADPGGWGCFCWRGGGWSSWWWGACCCVLGVGGSLRGELQGTKGQRDGVGGGHTGERGVEGVWCGGRGEQ